MNNEFKLNEGEQITKFHKIEDYTFWKTIFIIFGQLFIIYFIFLVINKIHVFEFPILFYIFLNLILFLIQIILYFKNCYTENSMEIYYFNDYLLITNIPYSFVPSLKNSDIKLNFDFIEYFMLKEGRMKIKIYDSKIKKSKFEKNNVDWFKLDSRFEEINMIINPKLKSKKRELIDFLNKKLK